MRIFRALLVFVAVSAAVTALSAQAPATGQAQGYRAPRTADGRPNLNGIWQAINEAKSDIQPHPPPRESLLVRNWQHAAEGPSLPRLSPAKSRSGLDVHPPCEAPDILAPGLQRGPGRIMP